ncbi:hypothetical protein P4571_08315 [Niallia alba]|uniref:hypothetical protein n=1 Tax=Niallia alba TaxID=2729105 RepID=UPI002E23143C|nr:hypothetical protein [Niallia alba]
MFLVKGDSLDCYGWEDGEKLLVLEDVTEKHGLPENIFEVLNLDREEKGAVLESQIVHYENKSKYQFINDLMESKASIKSRKYPHFNANMAFRMFEGFELKEGIRLSIQASYGHYCSPRETFYDLNEYSSMEFALIDSSGKFITVMDVLPTFNRLEEIEQYEDTVYGYVPVDLINELYIELTK